MSSAKRYLLLSASFALCMTIFAAFAPRVARAVTATLVQVVNTPSTPVPVAPVPARQAVSVDCIANLNDGSYEADCTPQTGPSNYFTVPAGKRFVFESATVQADLPTGQRYLRAYVIGPLAGSEGTLVNFRKSFDTTYQGYDWFTMDASGPAYFDGTLRFSVFRTSNSGGAFAQVFVSGHLEDIQ